MHGGKWLATAEGARNKGQQVGMDRGEYPNQKGGYPWIMVSWYEAADRCADEGKRRCSEDEWTFACEGEEATPYPYGYTRDATACSSGNYKLLVYDERGNARPATPHAHKKRTGGGVPTCAQHSTRNTTSGGDGPATCAPA